MYISLNMQELTMVHKHPDYRVVCNLCYMELGDAYSIFPIDQRSTMQEFTFFELQRMCKQYNVNCNTQLRPVMAKAIMDYFEVQPVTEVNGFELEVQCGKVNEDKCGQFVYVKGSSTPAFKNSQKELFPRG